MSFAQLPGWRSLNVDDVKVWLAETDDVDVVASAMKMLITIKPAGGGHRRRTQDFDEVMRRTERRLAELVRAGQLAGTLAASGRDKARSTRDVIDRHVLHYAYVMFDGVTDEQFEKAIATARSYGSISRSAMEDILHNGNRPDTRVADRISTQRRIAMLRERAEQGLTSDEIAAEFGWNRAYLRSLAIKHDILLVDRSRSTPKSVRINQIRNLAETGHRAGQIAQMLGIAEDRVRRLATGADIELDRIAPSRMLDANRIVNESVTTLEGVAMAIGLINVDELDPERMAGWAASLKDSMRTLQHLHKELTR